MSEKNKKNTNKFILFVVIILVCWSLGKMFGLDVEQLRSTLDQFPVMLSGAVYVALYVGLTFFVWLSKDILMVAGAWAFGIIGSAVLTYIAESFNAIVLFYMARKLGRDFVEEKTQGKFKDLDQRLANATFLDLVLLRIVILVPFRFLDLGFGLTKIPFKKYMLAVLIGTPIRTLMRQYYIVVIAAMIMDLDAFSAYVQDHMWLFYFSLGYFVIWAVLLIRLKKLVFGRKKKKIN